MSGKRIWRMSSSDSDASEPELPKPKNPKIKPALPINTVGIIEHMSYEVEHSTGQGHHPDIECPHCSKILKDQVRLEALNNIVFLNTAEDDYSVDGEEDGSLNLTGHGPVFKQMTSKQFITCQKCMNRIDLSASYNSIAQEYFKLGQYFVMVAAKIKSSLSII